jgi:hypothetical protein
MSTGTINPRRERTKHELRCFCRGNPMLAVYGVDEIGALYIHIKIYKQGKVYGEAYYTGGQVKIKCRNCLRWNRVVFVSKEPVPAAKLEETEPPVAVTEKSPAQSLRSDATDL